MTRLLSLKKISKARYDVKKKNCSLQKWRRNHAEVLNVFYCTVRKVRPNESNIWLIYFCHLVIIKPSIKYDVNFQ